MRNASLDETQAGIKIAERNINDLRNADDATFVVENEKELKNLLMKVKKESWEAGFSRGRILATACVKTLSGGMNRCFRSNQSLSRVRLFATP